MYSDPPQVHEDTAEPIHSPALQKVTNIGLSPVDKPSHQGTTYKWPSSSPSVSTHFLQSKLPSTSFSHQYEHFIPELTQDGSKIQNLQIFPLSRVKASSITEVAPDSLHGKVDTMTSSISDEFIFSRPTTSTPVIILTKTTSHSLVAIDQQRISNNP